MFRDIESGIISETWSMHKYTNITLYNFLDGRIHMSYRELKEDCRLTEDYPKVLLILRHDLLVVPY